MSQTRIRAHELQSRDWMRELQADVAHVQTVIARVYELANRGALANAKGDKREVQLRFDEIREGLALICELTGIKMVHNVTAT
jgi:hypothetical protein